MTTKKSKIENETVVKKGDKIKVIYEGTFEDGTVFDSSEAHDKPLEFEVGSSQVIKGFEDAMIGMKKGEEKKITLTPKDAYGDHNPELVKEIPREQLPKDHELKPGMMLLMSLPNGAQIPVKIAEVNDKTATLDLNHPLAGRTLNFKLTVVDINN